LNFCVKDDILDNNKFDMLGRFKCWNGCGSCSCG